MKLLFKYLSISIALICLSLLVSCGGKTPTDEPATSHSEKENTTEFTKAQYETARIELGKVQRKQIS